MANVTKTGHLFTVEILIEDATNGQALEKLLHLLNSGNIRDYQIKSGIDLGKLIELNIDENANKQTLQQKAAETKRDIPKKQAAAAAPIAKDQKYEHNRVIEQLEKFKSNHTLVRLTVVKGKGIKLSIPCRILNYDSETQNVSVYHVDEKNVYLFKLNEIDDFAIG